MFGFQSQSVFIVICGVLALHYSGKGPGLTRKVIEYAYGKAGCAPVSSVGNVTLHYFAGRGRGEVLRMMMKYAEISFTETKFTSDTWTKHKAEGIKSGLYPFGQVPVIETTKGIRLAQSQVIAHYLGRSTGMECNCDDLAFCEMIAEGTEDVRSHYGKMLYSPTFSLKDREKYLTETLPMWLDHFEKLAPSLSKQEKAFFASERLTWVDFLVFELLDSNRNFAKYDFGPGVQLIDVLEPYPKLTNFYEHMSRKPKLSAWLRSKRRPPFAIPNQPIDIKKKI